MRVAKSQPTSCARPLTASLWAMVVVWLGVTACVPIPSGFDSPVPGARIDASVRAASQQDAEAIPDLIDLLESEDPATRLIAANAIEWIIDRPIDFDHGAAWPARLASINKLRAEYEAGELVPPHLSEERPTDQTASEAEEQIDEPVEADDHG